MQRIGLAVIGFIANRDGMRLDGDPPLTFKVHRIQDLFTGLSGGDGSRQLKKPVSESGFPVIDVGDNGEVADVALQIVAHVKNRFIIWAPRTLSKNTPRGYEKSAATLALPSSICIHGRPAPFPLGRRL